MQNPRKKAEILEEILFQDAHTFPMRHIGPSQAEQDEMLQSLGLTSFEDLVANTVPASIQIKQKRQCV